MPLDFDDEVKSKAESLFTQGMISPTKVLEELKKEFKGKHEVPTHTRTIARWRNDWKERKPVQDSMATLAKEEAPTDIEQEPLIEEPAPSARGNKRLRRPPWLRDKELTKPPTLTELIESGVPRNIAPLLLANWDVAFEEDNYYKAKECERTAAIFKEFPGIRYKSAVTLGTMEATNECLGADHVREKQEISSIINIYKRYRPWEGKENFKAFRELFKRWIKTASPWFWGMSSKEEGR